MGDTTGWYPFLGGQGLYVDATAHYSSVEHWGMHLLNAVSRRVRIAFRQMDLPSILPGGYIPEGPHFVYEASRELFHGRRGRGPLFVAWDTNLLIDYFNFGELLWRDDDLPSSVGGDYAAELEGLQLVMALWVIRDIRFVILRQTINDAKKRLSEGRRSARLNAFHEFTSALRLVSSEDQVDAPSHDGLLILPDAELERAVQHVPAGFDQDLVRSAARMGIHVFLTNDKGILKQRNALRPFGLFLASPLDLWEALLGCGAFHCVLEPQYAYFPMPDQMRVGHLIRALSSGD